MAATEISTVILPLAPRGDFRNEPFVDFKSSANEHAMKAALERVGGMLGHEYELVIGGERVRTGKKLRSVNPAKPAQVVGIHQEAGPEHAEQAIAEALKAFETWQFVPVEQRTSLLLRAAAIIRERKFEFCAWLVYEVGKNWAEADADVARDHRLPRVLRARGAAARRTPSRPSSIPASATAAATSRSASARSFRRGTSPWPSWPA